MKDDFFLRLPQPVAVLLLSSLLGLTSAHVLYPLPSQALSLSQPLATKTLSHHALDVVSYPAPTSPPRPGGDVRRQEPFNTICGYLGGDANLAATCGAGSHCVLDTQHGAIGCCPDADPICTTGVFTGCVDGNSPPQTEIDPYVYTCHGGNVCYKNQFAGGFFQFGCGTASDLATSVLASASGVTTTLDRPSLTFSFTESAVTLSEPTTLGTVTSKPTASHTSQSKSATESSGTRGSSRSSITAVASSSVTSSAGRSTTSSATKSSSSVTTSSTSSSTSSSSSRSSSTSSTSGSSTSVVSATTAPTNNEPHAKDHTGAIIGGTISGVAVAVGLFALGFFFWRRHTGKGGKGSRRDTGDSTEYISPNRVSHDPGPAFAPLQSHDHDGWETGLPPENMASVGWGRAGDSRQGHTGREPSYPPAMTGSGSGYPAPYQPLGGYAAGAAGPAPAVPPRPERGLYDEPETGESAAHIPLTREIDDFSRGFHDALGRIGEEDESSSFYNSRTNVNEGNGVNGGGLDNPDGPYGGVRPLWQQQRRQSRNLMWM